MALIADNCETNKALSGLCEVPMIGCYSHRLALAVRDYLKPNDHLICKINTLMGKLNYPKLAGQLRQYTSLKPLQFCPTRCLSKMEMLERYLQIKEYVVKIDTLMNYMLSPQENVVIQTLTDSLAPLKSVTIALQRSDIDIAGARLLLDQLLNVKNLDSQGKYITTDCDIAKNPQFESGAIKAARLLLDQLLNVKNLDSQGKYITTDCDIAKNPQFESGAIKAARLLLDQLLNVKNLDSQGKYITTDCDIAKNPQFESGVIKSGVHVVCSGKILFPKMMTLFWLKRISLPPFWPSAAKSEKVYECEVPSTNLQPPGTIF